jgi:hypothetical protein
LPKALLEMTTFGTWPPTASPQQEQHDEWQDGRCHFSQQSMARLDPANQDRLTNPLTAGLAA